MFYIMHSVAYTSIAWMNTQFTNLPEMTSQLANTARRTAKLDPEISHRQKSYIYEFVLQSLFSRVRAHNSQKLIIILTSICKSTLRLNSQYKIFIYG
jgi:hypothetical protein